jgi:hypothetical protein
MPYENIFYILPVLDVNKARNGSSLLCVSQNYINFNVATLFLISFRSESNHGLCFASLFFHRVTNNNKKKIPEKNKKQTFQEKGELNKKKKTQLALMSYKK